MDDMKISFKVEVTACDMEGSRCPFKGAVEIDRGLVIEHCRVVSPHMSANNWTSEFSAHLRAIELYGKNKNGLTASCPMVKEQFERLE